MAGPERDPISPLDDSTATVMVNPFTVASPFVPDDRPTRFGSELLSIDDGVVVLGRQGLDGVTASIMPLPVDGDLPASGDPTVSDVILAERGIAASGDRMVVVDSTRLRLLRIGDDGRTSEVSTIVIDGAGRYGTRAVMAGDTVAVQRLSDSISPLVTRVDVYDLTDDVITPVVALQAEVGRAHLGIAADGAMIAISGVRGRADAGEVQFFGRDGGRWTAAGRIDAVGGGPIVADGAAFFVQRNGFFTRPSGPWTRLGFDDEGTPAIEANYPVQASSLAVAGDILAFGMPSRDRVLTFRSAADGAPDRPVAMQLTQVIGPPVSPDESPADPAEFGAAVRFASGRLIVSSPGRSADDVDDEGEVIVYTTALGPFGCTVIGTDGDDVLAGTVGEDVICGLGGNDVIDGNLGSDRLYGGPGQDDVKGAGGDDLIVGGEGNDRLDGGQGRDRLIGGEGDDQLFGGADADAFDGGPGNDLCFGGGDIDTFTDC